MDDKWLDLLAECPLFEGISQKDIKSIVKCMDLSIEKYSKSDYLTHPGQDFTDIGIVLSGTVALTKETASGNRVIIGLLGPGEMFGETNAYTDNSPFPMTVIAHDECIVIYFSRDKIVGCCEKACVCHKNLILNMLKIVSNKAVMLNKKVDYLAIKTLRGKISTFLVEEYKKKGNKTFQLLLNRHELADFLNTSRPSLSRELCKMRDEGLLDFHSNAIKIKDFDALKEMCE